MKTIPVAIVRTLPLTTSLVEKIAICNDNVASFTVFVNKKGNLAHVLRKGDDAYMRVPVPKAKRLHREADGVLEAYFRVRITHWLRGPL